MCCNLSDFSNRVKLWASAFGGEIKSIASKYSGSQLLQKVFPLFSLSHTLALTHTPLLSSYEYRWLCLTTSRCII